MIGEAETFQGIVFSRIVRNEKNVIIEKFIKNSNSSFVVNNVGLYIKYSTSRMSPWNFTFRKEHQDEIKNLYETKENVVIALVCGHDGIASLSYEELKQILDDDHLEAEAVRVHRPPRGKYHIKGTDGKMQKTIADSDFPSKIFDLNKDTAPNLSKRLRHIMRDVI